MVRGEMGGKADFTRSFRSVAKCKKCHIQFVLNEQQNCKLAALSTNILKFVTIFIVLLKKSL